MPARRSPRPAVAGARAFLVDVRTAEQEEMVFSLCSPKRLVTLPLGPDDWVPAPPVMAHWGVRSIPFEEAERLAAAAGVGPGLVSGPTSAGDLVVSLGACEAEGRLFAANTRRAFRHCRSWPSLVRTLERSSAGSVAVVAGVTDLPYDLFDALARSGFGSERSSAGLGFLTGHSRGAVRWSVLKALLLEPPQAADGDLFLYGRPNGAPGDLFGEIETLWWDDLTPERVGQLTGRRFFFVGLVSHSNGVDGNLAKAVLCPVGAPERAPKPESPAGSPLRPAPGSPSCVHSDLCQRDPERTRLRVHPHELRADVLFYDTCAGFLTAGAFASPRASLGLAFVTGTAAALVTSIRKKTSAVYSPLLCRSLLYDGAPLGEVVRRLNRYQRCEFGELPSFILLGDPAFRVPRNTATEPRIEEAASGALEIRGWTGTSLAVPAARGRSVPVPDERSRGLLCIDAGGAGRGRREWWLVRQSRSPSGLAVRPRDIERATARLRTVSRALHAGIHFLDVVQRGVRVVDDTADAGALAYVVESARAAIPLLDHLRQEGSTKAWHHAKLEAFEEGIRRATDTVNALDRLLVFAWKAARQWAVFCHYYGHSLVPVEREAEAGACCVCGHWTTRKRSSHPEFPDVVRDLYTCIRCGVVADVPAGVSPPLVEGPHRCRPGDTIQERVSFELGAPTDVPAELLVYFGGFGSEVVQCTIDPPVASARAGKGGRVESEFRLRVGESCPPGLYSLVVFASSLLRPIVAAKYLSVEPRYGAVDGSRP